MKVVRFGLTVCLFAVTSFSAAETSLEVWPAAAQEGPIFVWFKDGRTLEAVGPVKQDDQMLVFRLANSTLVSVNVGNVERITAVPARPGAVGPKDNVATKRNSPSEPPRVFRNEDLPAPLVSQPAPVTPAAPEAPPAPGTHVAADGEQRGSVVPGEYLDRNGRNEQWWRDRMSRLKEEIETTQKNTERLEDGVRVAKARALGAGVLPSTRSSLDTQKVYTYDEAVAELKAARTRLEELTSEMDGLPEEARRARALPGWLR